MKWLLLGLIILTGCSRQLAVDNGIEITPIIEEEKEEGPSFTNVIVRLEIGNYCTNESIKEDFKDTEAAKIEAIHFADSKFKYVNFYKFIEFRNKFEDFKRLNGLSIWRKRFDCDDFSQLFMIFLKMDILSQELNNRFQHNILEEMVLKVVDFEPEGLAVGEIWYKKEAETEFGVIKQKHAINVIYLGPDNYIFIEPQDSSVIMLTPNEMRSIYFVRF